ncbi:GDP-mannose mannosyl hydrolase [Pseudomonas sp. LRF_L74]|uniref:GDP-mannose mannosyl hydrolase n=1 Tax=Pseudomonas sp. LRF_L74 TaxID=3369422 RepID=UPI003F5D99DC
MWLTHEDFRTVLASTPLVSIDLVVCNNKGEILLGQRLNRPAKGYWFVPGGRILKNETLDAAFIRLTRTELGQVFERSQARLLDVYEHFYLDTVFGCDEIDTGTHYVVLGYQLLVSDDHVLTPPPDQHGCYRWWKTTEMQDSTEIHENTRVYLKALR